MPSTVPTRTGLLVTCPVDLCRPALGFTAVERLRAVGCGVEVPAQGCCGRTALEKGDRRGAALMARTMIDAFEGYEHVVASHGACAAMVRDQYPLLLNDDPAWAGRAHDLAGRCRNLTDFLTGTGDETARGQAVAAIRDRTLTQLDRHLDLFEARARAVGSQIHWAGDAAEALAIIRQICLSHGVGPVMHDGSPLTVEIGLDAALAEAGMNGSGMPSMPLIGITGACFLVARTGSAVIVPGDGNAAPALARCHIVLAAIDRIVPDLSDAGQLLRLSHAERGMPARVLFTTGPRQPDDADGPDRVHVVLLDNGRADLQAASVAPPPTMARRAGPVWRLLASRPGLYRRVTSWLMRIGGRGGSFQARWRNAGHG